MGTCTWKELATREEMYLYRLAQVNGFIMAMEISKEDDDHGINTFGIGSWVFNVKDGKVFANTLSSSNFGTSLTMDIESFIEYLQAERDFKSKKKSNGARIFPKETPVVKAINRGITVMLPSRLKVRVGKTSAKHMFDRQQIRIPSLERPCSNCGDHLHYHEVIDGYDYCIPCTDNPFLVKQG